jgi:hypothetical protein
MRTLRYAAAALAMILAVGVVYLGLVGPALLGDRGAADQAEVVRRMAERPDIDPAQEERLARAYWARNPDVAGDSYFGEQGRLGVFGARTHYERHGQREGRAWGDQSRNR